MSDDETWDFLPNLTKTLPVSGEGSPDIEAIKEEAKGQLWEISTKIWMWSDLDNHKYQLHSVQNLAILGEFTKEEAQKKINSRTRRKKSD